MFNWIEVKVKDVKWWIDLLFSLIVNVDVELFMVG